MSHYLGWAIHPDTGRTHRAMWIDGAFGGRRYGVQFLDDAGQPVGPVYPEAEIETGGDFPSHRFDGRREVPSRTSDNTGGDAKMEE